MRTVSSQGNPYGFEDLVNTFNERVETLANFAGVVEMHYKDNAVAVMLTVAIAQLRADWEDCEEALREADMREHPEDYGRPRLAEGGAR